MDEKDGNRGGNAPNQRAPKAGAPNKGAGIRVPVPGESSSSGVNPSLDSPTLVDIPKHKLSDAPARRISSDAPTYVGGVTSAKGSGSVSPYLGAPILEVGTILGQRYEIRSILGVGGMGAVYQARDLELGRTVALKVIRPDLAGNQSIIDRFKQELILATQVTHRNVVRIYDLGESEGMKFITMEFVEGQDLRSLIFERTKLPATEAVEIMQQVCRALEAAHGVGVIHRDLKPQNIMLDVNGRVVVMDFGLARTLGGDGMTQSGALVGTMEYMSPEQALAKELDQRSDIFSLGVIFYELLSGAIPFRADSALASLIKRTQERVVPVTELDDTIPAPLSAIVSRCLERDLELRYQSASELLADLDAWQGKRPISQTPTSVHDLPSVRPSRPKRLWLGGGGVALALILAAAYFGFRTIGGPAHSSKTVLTPASSARTLAVLPLHNASGDPKLDWLGAYVADTLSTDIGQSSELHTLPSDRMHQVMSDLQVAAGAAIDPDTLRHVVDLTGSDISVTGQYVRLGEQIEIDATLQDFKRDRRVTVKATAANDQALPTAIDALADKIRTSLDFSSNEIKQMKAQAFKPTSQSIDALRDYSQGLELMRTGKNLDANQSFTAAVNADPQFALAFAALAQTQAALGHQADAEQSSRRAVELAATANLSQPEKDLINASRATILNETKKAISIYEGLAQEMPGNVEIEYALGTLYSDTGDYPKARAEFAKILDTDPRNVLALWQSGVVEFRSGNPQAALEPLSKAAYLTIDNKEQHAMILLAMGITYRRLQKPDEALKNFNDSIAISEKIGQKRAFASGLDEIAQMQTDLGKPDAALANYKKALALFQEIGANKEAGNPLIDMATLYQARGDNDQALPLFRQALQIERDAGDQNYEALCLASIAEVYLAKGDTESAFTYFQQALQLGQKLGVPDRIGDPLQGLGDVYTLNGQYDEALASLKLALDTWRSAGNAYGVATTQRQMGVVFQNQSRFGAAVESIRQSVKGFHDLGEKSGDAAQALQNLAEALAKAGRGDEAAAPLAEAESMANVLKNDTLTAQIFGTKGDIAFYRGDYTTAAAFFQSALQAATRGKDHDGIIQAKLNLARVAIAQGKSADAVNRLRSLVGIDPSSDRSLALHCSVTLAEALIQNKDYNAALQTLQAVAGAAEKSGMHLLLARIYYLRATASRLGGNSGEAWAEYRQAMALLNTVRNEPGAENILRRSDLKAIFDDCNRWVGVGAPASRP
jgi:serine/threonine protein kinase/tetratricopeptide (TPR) repeat protein